MVEQLLPVEVAAVEEEVVVVVVVVAGVPAGPLPAVVVAEEVAEALPLLVAALQLLAAAVQLLAAAVPWPLGGELVRPIFPEQGKELVEPKLVEATQRRQPYPQQVWRYSSP